MLRRIFLLTFALVLLVAACGGDDDDTTASDTTVKKTTTSKDNADNADGDDDTDATSSGDALSEDDYKQAFAASLQDDDTGFGLSDDEANCATDKVLDEIGADRLQEAGMTEEFLSSSSADATDLTEKEARTIVDSLFDCADMGEAFARQVAGGLESQDNVTADQAKCFGDKVGDDDSIRDIMALSLREGDSASLPHDSAEHLVDLMTDCFDFGQLFVTGLEEGGVTVTDEQADCISSELKDNETFREGLISTFAGEDDAAGEDSMTSVFMEIAGTCGIDLGAGSGVSS